MEYIVQPEIRVKSASEVEDKMIDSFVYDLRMLHAISGSGEKAAQKIGKSRDTVFRWYRGRCLPRIRDWIDVKRALATEILKAQIPKEPYEEGR